ncbi:hypothetical protein [Pseudomonas fulva]|uniref:hypothetical protein n=1 Tax=Pseudomonas fulva TaxID=47880 RepID=UPI0034CED65C
MKIQNPTSEESLKNLHTYENNPFINPEDGQLPAITWRYISDVDELSLDTTNDIDSFPEHYLQITPQGEVRGVTCEPNTHSNYFSVASDGLNVVFLKMHTERYPGVVPSLADLLPYRQYMQAKLKGNHRS